MPTSLARVLLAAALLAKPSAFALSGDGTSATPPAGAADPGWAHVGTVNGLSCVFLGSYSTGYWVLTASHVGVSDGSFVTVGGGSYGVVAGSEVRFQNADSTHADLTLFRISGDAGLAGLGNLSILGNAPGVNSTVTQIGFGGGTKNYGQTTVSSNHGYGTIQRDGNGDPVVGADYSNFFQSYSTGVQAIPGDSGGGVFSNVAGQWYLSGIMQATGTSVQGPTTYYITQSIELSDYRAQIDAAMTSAVPEPSTYGLLGGMALAGVALVRRRRRATKSS